MLWTENDGMRSLKDVLVNQYGLDLTAWTLTVANDISDDGRIIVGAGINPSGLPEGWMATVPEPSTFVMTVMGLFSALAVVWSRQIRRRANNSG
jgi:hypothetical protein